MNREIRMTLERHWGEKTWQDLLITQVQRARQGKPELLLVLQDWKMKDGEAVNSRRVFYTPAALAVLKDTREA